MTTTGKGDTSKCSDLGNLNSDTANKHEGGFNKSQQGMLKHPEFSSNRESSASLGLKNWGGEKFVECTQGSSWSCCYRALLLVLWTSVEELRKGSPSVGRAIVTELNTSCHSPPAKPFPTMISTDDTEPEVKGTKTPL